MKTGSKILKLAAIVPLMGLAACHGSVSSPSNPLDNIVNANGTPNTPPANCTSYAGKYQMNMDNFEIQQDACNSVKKISTSFDDQTGQSTTMTEVFTADGQPHDDNGVAITSSFIAGNLQMEMDIQGHHYRSVLSFQTAPCQLANPDGQSYLTSDVYIDGVWNFDQCKFWSKIQ